MDLPVVNLERLRPSRRKLKPGDVFVAQPRGHPYLIGRVIRTDASLFGDDNLLLYFYDAWTANPSALPMLDPRKLLIPPVVTNRLGWSRGYFEHIEERPLAPGETLPAHSFASHIHTDGPHYVDEFGNTLAGPVEPVGDAGLHSYRSIDDLISDAIGLPRAPESL